MPTINTLDQLCDALNDVEHAERQLYQNQITFGQYRRRVHECGLDNFPAFCGDDDADFPTFGGTDAYGPCVYSWDATRLLIYTSNLNPWSIISREEYAARANTNPET